MVKLKTFENNYEDEDKKIIDSVIKVLGYGEIFGEEEVVKKCRRKNSITCVSIYGEILLIRASDFFAKIYN